MIFFSGVTKENNFLNKITSKIFKKKIKLCWELDFFRLIRGLSDGITLFEYEVDLSVYSSDHNPQFQTMLTLFNFKIFEFTIYNMYHEESDEYDYN